MQNKTFNFVIEPELADYIGLRAKELCVSRSDVVRMILKQALLKDLGNKTVPADFSAKGEK
jgi:hypothetical protein